ncbi:MAG: virulence RhuM family protein [Bacteroidales bacterium]|nr:virulence RhuM family protein [Bacteroidales bacterium]
MKTNIDPANKGEIILYQPDDEIRLEVRMEDETVWLNRQQMAILFGRDVKTIGKHIQNALREELMGFPTVANFATVQKEGNRFITREIEYYNLDMVLSVGYRVKSSRGIEFRRWANSVLKNYLMSGYAVNLRLDTIEAKVAEQGAVLAEHTKQIGFFVRTALPPVQGIYYDGQIFDAYTFAADLIRSAKKRIILIDNYVDDSVLKTLTKRAAGVAATIVTRRISDTLAVDIERHNRQYTPVEVRTSDRFHDRFLILDDTVYHLGASLKDLGKKLFAFCRIEVGAELVLDV